MQISINTVQSNHKYPYLIISTICILIFSPSFFQELWLIDDHEIVWFLSTLKEEGLIGFWHQWLQLPDFGSMQRFRPVYYLLRAAEILVWRDNVFLWVSARFLIVFAFAASIYIISNKYFTSKTALAFSLLTICSPWVSDIFFRLGPSEAYAVLFSALLIFFLSLKDSPTKWLGIAFVVVMLAGIKENFIIFIPLGVWSFIELLKSRNIVYASLACVFVLISISIFVVIIYKLKISSGLDIYNDSIGLSRFNQTIKSLFDSKYGYISTVLYVIALFSYVKINRSKKYIVKAELYFFIICSLILLFNLYFYAGVPGIRSRYAFPYWVILIGMMLVYTTRVISLYYDNKNFSYAKHLKFALVTSVVFIFTLMTVQNIKKSYRYANLTKPTKIGVTKIIESSQFVDQIVVHTFNTLEYEPVFSLPRFLKYSGVENNLYLKVDEKFRDSTLYKTSSLSEKLKTELKRIEVNGGRGYSPSQSGGIVYDRCMEVVFTETKSNICKTSVYIKFL